jgi:hypothetical protein
VLVVVERGADLRHVEARLLRVALEVGPRQRALVLEQDVVHLPELLRAALLERLHREVRGGAGLGVERERVVAPDDAHLAAVLVQDARRRREDAGAERTLELRDLDDGDERVLGALARLVGGDGHAVAHDLARRRRALGGSGAACGSDSVGGRFDADVGDRVLVAASSAGDLPDGKAADERDHDRDDG